MPRTYNYINSEEETFGIIAEELAATELKAAVVYDKNGRPDAINYSLLVAPLIKIVQDQNEKITYLQKKVKKLKAPKSRKDDDNVVERVTS